MAKYKRSIYKVQWCRPSTGVHAVRRAVADTSLEPIGGVIKELVDQIVAAKAKAIYDWTCENMQCYPEAKSCSTGEVCTMIANLDGKCTGIHSYRVKLAVSGALPLNLQQAGAPLKTFSVLLRNRSPAPYFVRSEVVRK
ncbi:MAG: hypothetical protein ACK5PS_00760 [Desulfopila sp.]